MRVSFRSSRSTLEKAAQARYEASIGSIGDVLKAKVARLQAEIDVHADGMKK